MELEELTKSQIILLVLLVSFVTSIATGIVTVSLLAQAPPAVTQTVNRIVERTVETVVPAEDDQAAAVITKETTVVVKEDDLVTESISTTFGKVARIYEGTSTSTPVVALGTVIGNGVIVTDWSAVLDEHLVSIGAATYLYKVSSEIPEIGVAVLSAVDGAPNVSAIKSIDSSSVKLGQTLVALYGTKSDRVSMSILSGKSDLVTLGTGDDARTTTGLVSTSDVTLTPGAPLITVYGELVGVSTSVSRKDSKGTFVAYSDIRDALQKLASTATATTTPAQ